MFTVFAQDDSREGDMRQAPGLGIACAEWLHRREVAAVACDNNAVEVLPFEDPTLPLRVTGAVGSPLNPLAVK